MKTATIQRGPSTEEGTFGKLETSTGFKCVTLERPADGEHPCIPAGTYQCSLRKSNDNYVVVNGVNDYQVYGVQNVPGRDNVEIHSGNWFFQILGCILLGQEVAQIETPYKTMMNGVNHSRNTLTAFMADMSREDFTLTIVEPPVKI